MQTTCFTFLIFFISSFAWANLEIEDLSMYVLSSFKLMRSRVIMGQIAGGWPKSLIRASNFFVVIEEGVEALKLLEELKCNLSNVLNRSERALWLEEPALQVIVRCKQGLQVDLCFFLHQPLPVVQHCYIFCRYL